jgi:hypothetical protein
LRPVKRGHIDVGKNVLSKHTTDARVYVDRFGGKPPGFTGDDIESFGNWNHAISNKRSTISV